MRISDKADFFVIYARSHCRMLLGPSDQPAPLRVAVREVGSSDLPDQAVRHAAVDHRRRHAVGHRPNIPTWPDESVGFRRDDPRRSIIKTQAALDVLWKSHRIGRIGWWCMSDGKDEDLGGPIGLLDGQGEHQSGAILAAFHLGHDPSASDSFAETHARRLEAMRRLTGNVVREADGTWIIAADHLEQAAIFERRQAKDVPVVVQTLSSLPLDRQVGADGATWLDQELLAATPEPLRESGFGKDVLDAQVRRRQWLIAEGLAREEQGRVVYRGDMLDTLRRRELVRVAGQLSDELCLGYVETGKGDRVEGFYRRAIDLASGKFAIIEKSREFTLAPWRPVLERHLDQQVSGVMRGEGISWTIGRERSGQSVT